MAELPSASVPDPRRCEILPHARDRSHAGHTGLIVPCPPEASENDPATVWVLLDSEPDHLPWGFGHADVAYLGAVCPLCNRVAYARKPGHEPGCRFSGTATRSTR